MPRRSELCVSDESANFLIREFGFDAFVDWHFIVFGVSPTCFIARSSSPFHLVQYR